MDRAPDSRRSTARGPWGPRTLALLALVTLSTTQLSAAEKQILHEQIAPDPRDDLAQSVSLDGDLPAAIETPSGIVAAPDPRRPVTPNDRPSDAPFEVQGHAFNAPPDFTFVPDSDTRRPEELAYEDPFTPSTAPFKRLIAVDAVDAKLALVVHDAAQVAIPVSIGARPAADGSEEQFYGDMVVDLEPGKRVRIPSVGPGARVLRARAGVGSTDVGYRLYRDGADNWFIEGDRQIRARFVIEMAIARRTFGGEFGDPGWSDLKDSAPLPPKVAEEANKVALAIGVSHALTPRENVKKLVEYFRSFTDSDTPPVGQDDIYLNLALSKKGVCRHRAYAFLVTALGLGLPARMIMNEAHAWVEVHDGSLWRRIDLGGAGRTLSENLASDVPYAAPPDPFAWPPDATKGDDLVDRSRLASQGPDGPSSGGGRGSRAGEGGANGATRDLGKNDPARDGSPQRAQTSYEHDERPTPRFAVSVFDPDARRGAPLHVRGEVRADGEPCSNVVVDVLLRDVKNHARERFLGTLATDADGAFGGALVVPGGVPLGDYDIVVRTPGDARCAPGTSTTQ